MSGRKVTAPIPAIALPKPAAAAFVKADRVMQPQRIVAQRVALTADQVAEYGLPTAPPKRSGSRSAKWRGETCQLEALAPDDLAGIVERSIRRLLDHDVLRAEIALEDDDRTQPAAGAATRMGRRRRLVNAVSTPERRLACGEPHVLLPSRGHDDGRRLCLACGHADRRGELADAAEAVALALFSDEDGDSA